MKNYWPAWITCFIITGVAAVVAGLMFRVPCIVRLELAPDPETMAAYIQSITATTERSYHILFMNTLADFLFLTGYTLLTFFSFKILLDVFEAPTVAWVYILSGLTGFFDILENNVLISSALRHREDFSGLYYWIVRVKWACAIIPLMIIPVALLYGIITYLTRDKKKKTSINNS